MVFDELGDGIYRRRYASLDLNVGVVVGEDAVLIVDSRASHAQADELKAELRHLTPKPVAWVVNTHMHWDHVWGNARFPEAGIVGHSRTRRHLVDDGETARGRLLTQLPEEWHDDVRAVDIVPPNETFEAIRVLDIGGRSVQLTHHGRAHTDCDVVVHVVGSDVMFAGDMVEEGAPPAFGDAFPLDWAHTLEALEHDLVDVVVPGHGDVVDPTFVTAQRRDIAALASVLLEAWREGRPVDELPEGPFPHDVCALAYGRVGTNLGIRAS